MSGRGRRTARRADLSQHFLRDGAIAASLVAHSSITPADRVIEIGPGTGRLTDVLARRCGELLAVELDPRLAGELGQRYERARHVEIRQGDFLELPLPASGYKVFSSLPFSRTTDVIRRLTGAPNAPEDAYLVLQAEAALRFAGAPYAAETLQSLLLKPWWQIEVVRRIPRTSFLPPPSVDCALLWLARRPRPLVEARERGLYRGLLGHAFGRGPTLRGCLGTTLSRVQLGRLARELRFDPGGSASSLRFDQWLGIFRFVSRTADRGLRRRLTRDRAG